MLNHGAMRSLQRGSDKLAHRTLASLVSHQKDKTFENQKTLPRLPIPSLEQTTARYLKSLLPLLSKEEHLNSQKLVEDFIRPGGVGETLQQRLKTLQSTEQVALYLLTTRIGLKTCGCRRPIWSGASLHCAV